MLYRGHDHLNRSFFAYVLCDRRGVAKMRNDYAAGESCELQNYGKVIHLRLGNDPDEADESLVQEFVSNYSTIKDLL